MRLLAILRDRLRSLLRRDRLEQELDEELRSHLERQIEMGVAAGMSPEEARMAAQREFGSVSLEMERCRDARGTRMIENFFDDVRHALRALRRDPVLALAAAATLAVSIGANTTVFSLLDTILLRPLPYPDSDRIHWVSERFRGQATEVGLGPDYYSMRDEGRDFAAIAAYQPTTQNWTGVEKPEQVDEAQVTASFFRVFGSNALLGRYLAPGEEGSKAPPVAVLSYAFWRSRFGSDPHIVGKAITLDGLSNTVIGVMPQGFDYPHGAQIWRPFDMDEATQRPRLMTRPIRFVDIVARVKPGVDPRQLRTEMARLTHEIRGEYPKEFERAGFLKWMAISAVPLRDRLVGDMRPALLALTGAVALVLLIACVNLANLLLARAGARQRELAVRLALGSSRGRIARQMLTESLTLALPGGLAGMALAWIAVATLNAAKPLALDRFPAIAVDARTLAFTFGITVLTALAFGMVPALASTRIDIHDALKAAGLTHSSGAGSARVRRLLVTAELALSLMLLIGAGLLAKSFIKLAGTPLGFPPDHLLTMSVNLRGSRYATGDGQVRFFDDVLQRLQQLPVVRSAAVSTDVPLGGDQPYSRTVVQVAGRPPLPRAQQPQVAITVVSAGFFRTLGIPLKAGRIFAAHDSQSAPAGIVVNETLAHILFPGEDAVGKQIVPPFGAPWTIVGIVGDTRAGALGARPMPLVYHCTCQGANSFLNRMKFIVHTTGDPDAVIRQAEGQIYAVDRNEPVFDVKTMEQRLNAALAPQRFQLWLIGIFAAIAILLAAAGVYGVMSYLVTRRRREIGIRMAMGARPGDVLRLVVGESIGLALGAAVIGLGGAWVLTRYVKSLLYGVTALDAPTFAMAAAVLGTLVVAASLGPALRASEIDPVSALREE